MSAKKTDDAKNIRAKISRYSAFSSLPSKKRKQFGGHSNAIKLTTFVFAKIIITVSK